MKEIKSVYSRKIEIQQRLLVRYRNNRNIYLVFILTFFSAFLFFLYMAIKEENEGIYYMLSVISFLLYFSIFLRDKKIKNKQKESKFFLRNYQTEIRYLEGNLTSLSNHGNKYISREHNYSYDLDIFGENSLFHEINRTISEGGSDKLAYYLQNLLSEEKEILYRQKAINELNNNIDWCNKFRVIGQIYPIHNCKKEIKKWVEQKFQINKMSNLLYFLNATCCFSIIYGIISGSYLYLLIVLFTQLSFAIVTVRKINHVHFRLDILLKNISNFFYLIKHIEQIRFNAFVLKKMQKEFKGGNNALLAFNQLKRIQNSLDSRNNILGFLIFNSLFVRDIHIFIALTRWKKNYGNCLLNWFDVIYEFDALISMGIYKFNHPQFIVPIVDTKYLINFKLGAHPLMRGNTVENDFKIQHKKNFFIMTGANMSGKSTFLRAIGVNLVLALSGNVVRANQFKFSPITLYTSMRTSDNLVENKSYFNAEILRLKKIHEIAKEKRNVFILLDEILKGTNSKDKFNGTKKFLQKLLDFDISGIIATHDLDIGSTLVNEYPNNFFNCCFEIEFLNEDLVYPYKLQEGMSKNMNASFLLKKYNLI